MIRFLLNGNPVEIPDEENRTLLEYLRNVKCMKGTKEACGTGHCGACSVLIDGKLARACVTMLKRLEGRTVETIESAQTDAMLQVIQRSFLDVGAVQCGFCIPGMVLCTKALLDKNQNVQTILHLASGNDTLMKRDHNPSFWNVIFQSYRQQHSHLHLQSRYILPLLPE